MILILVLALTKDNSVLTMFWQCFDNVLSMFWQYFDYLTTWTAYFWWNNDKLCMMGTTKILLVFSFNVFSICSNNNIIHFGLSIKSLTADIIRLCRWNTTRNCLCARDITIWCFSFKITFVSKLCVNSSQSFYSINRAFVGFGATWVINNGRMCNSELI